MGPQKRNTKREEPQFTPHESYIEKLFGKYTQIAVAGILVILILIILTVALFRYENLSGTIVTGLLTTFGSVAGFVVGKDRQIKK